jgi:hypothetical protein
MVVTGFAAVLGSFRADVGETIADPHIEGRRA